MFYILLGQMVTKIRVKHNLKKKKTNWDTL